MKHHLPFKTHCYEHRILTPYYCEAFFAWEKYHLRNYIPIKKIKLSNKTAQEKHWRPPFYLRIQASIFQLCKADGVSHIQQIHKQTLKGTGKDPPCTTPNPKTEGCWGSVKGHGYQASVLSSCCISYGAMTNQVPSWMDGWSATLTQEGNSLFFNILSIIIYPKCLSASVD